MSVPVTAVTLVVPRSHLDRWFPGGVDGFLAEMRHPARRAKSVAADEHLVAVSFRTRDRAEAAAALLRERGLAAEHDREFQDFAYVREARGPVLPCPWLRWERERGVTRAWLAGTTPGAVARAESTRPAVRDAVARHTANLRRSARGDRLVLLAATNGVEHWLDLATGRQFTASPNGAPLPPSAATDSGFGDEGPLMHAMLAAMNALQWTPERPAPGVIRLIVNGATVNFLFLAVVNNELQTVTCYGVYPERVDPDSRLRVAEFLMRINWRFSMLGGFELDFTDGEVRFRHAIDVEGGVLTVEMAKALVSCVCHPVGLIHPFLMRVTFGGTDAETAAEAYAKFVQTA